jgi:predicted 3-demethylubiquinone-9 3-methyltransferase (glyoxalase superfamily)
MKGANAMQKITPFLWFEKNAGEVASFYSSVFKDAEIKNTTTLHDTPSGTVDVINIELLGQEITMMAAGPLFKFTPAVSFLVACRKADEVDAIWEKLAEGGSPLMPLDKYPFSDRYGWLMDKYGLSWQVMFMGDREIRQRIVPTLMFVGNQAGKAEEAINLYRSVFNNSEIDHILRYTSEDKPDKEGTIKHAGFTLEGQEFAAMDSARAHDFTFNEAISFEVHCENQQEVDRYWNKLSADPNAEQCGWLKDQYGVSWQIVPTVLNKMLQDKDREKIARVTQAFLKMKKLDIAALKRAYEGGGK